MPSKKLKDYLDEHHIKYVSISHSPAFTAREIAESAHIPGKELAKTVVIKIDGKMALIILPANMQVNFAALQQEVGNDNIELASETEFKNKFPDCELGAMPPFGNLYDMDVYVAQALTNDVSIAFNAGTHSELIQLKYADFNKCVNPKVVNMTS